MEIILVLIVLNVVLYILPFIINFSGPSSSSFYNFLFLGWKSNADIASGEYYRLITSTFLHGSTLHLFVNMYSLWSIGPAVATVFGNFGFMLIYILSGLGGSIASYFFSPNPSVGASGSIFGLVGALIVFSIITQNTRLLNQLIIVAGANLLIGFTPGGRIDNFGHIGGLIGGIVIAFLFYTLYGFAILR